MKIRQIPSKIRLNSHQDTYLLSCRISRIKKAELERVRGARHIPFVSALCDGDVMLIFLFLQIRKPRFRLTQLERGEALMSESMPKHCSLYYTCLCFG